jgi:uncharacterized protein YndB with AHSA1/START domain
MIDIVSEINATRREVAAGRAGEPRSVRLRRRYAAAIEDVWDACTSPERIARWFLPVTGDLRPAGAAAENTTHFYTGEAQPAG